MNNNLIQFLQEKTRFFILGFTDEELVFFEIHFKTPGIFRGNFEFEQFISCR